MGRIQFARIAALSLLAVMPAVVFSSRVAAQYAQGDRAWFRAEYLAWQLDGVALPPLATSSPSTTSLANAGVLGQSTTTILAGNQTVANDYSCGYRLSGGVALDDCNLWQVVGDYFDVGGNNYDYNVGDTANTIIARPFFNTQTATQDAELVSAPDELSGTLQGGYTSRFQGAGIGASRNLLCPCECDCGSPCGSQNQLAVFGGYRYYRYNSDLGIGEDLLVLPNTTSPLVPGTTILVNDQFRATNEFHGGELGLSGRLQRAEWWLDGLAALAVGNNRRTMTIGGSTTTTVPSAGSSTASGGLLTSSETNIGRYVDNQVTVIPRFRLGLGCQVTQRWSATAGYNVILWEGAATAADWLPPNLAVDPRNLPPVQAGGGADPRFAGFQSDLMVVHGFDAGVTFVY